MGKETKELPSKEQENIAKITSENTKIKKELSTVNSKLEKSKDQFNKIAEENGILYKKVQELDKHIADNKMPMPYKPPYVPYGEQWSQIKLDSASEKEYDKYISELGDTFVLALNHADKQRYVQRVYRLSNRIGHHNESIFA